MTNYSVENTSWICFKKRYNCIPQIRHTKSTLYTFYNSFPFPFLHQFQKQAFWLLQGTLRLKLNFLLSEFFGTKIIFVDDIDFRDYIFPFFYLDFWLTTTGHLKKMVVVLMEMSFILFVDLIFGCCLRIWDLVFVC